jgi:hypothetical protein
MSRALPITLLVVAAVYASVAAYLLVGLDADLFVGDVRYDWYHGLYLHMTLDPWRGPGYHALLAVAQRLAPASAPPLALMMTITAASLAAACVLSWRLLRRAGLAPSRATVGVVLFALWPFEGVVDVIFPRADMVAMAVLLGGLALLQSGRGHAGAATLGLAALVHKALWPAVAVLWLVHFLRRDTRARITPGSALVLLALPTLAVWLAGIPHHGNWDWYVASNMQLELASHGGLPVLDGLVGTLLMQGTTGMLKGAWLLLIAGSCAATVAVLLRHRLPGWDLGVALAAGVLVLAVLVNQYEAWIVGRFGRLAALPLLWTLGHIQVELPRAPVRLALGLGAAALIASQFVWAWYAFGRA